MPKPDAGLTDFGYEQVPWSEKARRVGEVFTSVAGRYDLMNDLMSMGVHRVWKRFVIDLAGVREGERVLDVAGGTGDLTVAFARQVGPGGLCVLSDINGSMLAQGRTRLVDEGILGVPAVQADAEGLPFADRSFDCVTIAFGLRNVTDKAAALRSMLRVLKPGGRLLILEFSKPRSQWLGRAYDEYSFRVLPWLGRTVAQDEDSYRYLAESIRRHPDQETLKGMMQEAGFDRCQVYDLSGGIVAVHRGFKKNSDVHSFSATEKKSERHSFSPALAGAALEVAMNRYLALEPEVLAQCAKLEGKVLALHAAGPEWEFFLRFHKPGVQVLDRWEGEPDVRISARALHLFRQALASAAEGETSLSGVRVEGDVDLLSRFRGMLAKVGFDPEEWLAKWVGDGAAHRINGILGGLLKWGRSAADTLALDTAEYLREETRDLAHRDDVERWMDAVDNLRDRSERLAARLQRLEARRGVAR